MSSVPFSFVISNSGTITVFVNGKPYAFERNNPSYDRVKEAVARKDEAEIERLGNIPRVVEDYAGGNVKVQNGTLTYKSRQLDNGLARRILSLMREGFPFDSMVRFLDNLMRNPSRHAVQELYNFLVNRNLPITENGCFLAYKAVRPDYMDWHTGTVRNEIGDVVEMERNEVDEEWRNECSSGFHVGAIEYVQDFHRGQGHIMIVEVDPKDVVSVPVNEFTKCRTCKYTVVGEMDGELVAQLYKTTPTSYAPSPAPSVPSMASVSNQDDDDDYPSYDEDEEDDDDDYDDEDGEC